MVLVTSSRPPWRTCTHVLRGRSPVSLPGLAPGVRLKASQFWKRVLNGKRRCPGGQSAGDLHIYHQGALEGVRTVVDTGGKEMQSAFLSSREEKSLLDQRWDSFQEV